MVSKLHILHGMLGKFYRDEQPERRIYSAPGAMRNPEGVSHKAERQRSRDV